MTPEAGGAASPGTAGAAARPAAPEAEVLIHESRIRVPYAWSAGETLTRFLRGLRDSKVFLATRCPSCSAVYLPPRKSCGACFADCGEWLEVGPAGTLVSFTQALYDSPAHPRPKPVFGLIRLDRADSAVLHLLDGAPPESWRIGMRVEPVFAEKRSGSILDVAHFRPETPPDPRPA